MPTTTLDPTLVVDLSHKFHLVFRMENPHKDYFVWRAKMCTCEPECILSAGFGYLPKEPWSKFSVQIPSARRPGEMQTYCFSDDPEQISRLIYNSLDEEHRKGCVLPKRTGRKPKNLVSSHVSSVIESYSNTETEIKCLPEPKLVRSK